MAVILWMDDITKAAAAGAAIGFTAGGPVGAAVGGAAGAGLGVGYVLYKAGLYDILIAQFQHYYFCQCLGKYLHRFNYI